MNVSEYGGTRIPSRPKTDMEEFEEGADIQEGVGGSVRMRISEKPYTTRHIDNAASTPRHGQADDGESSGEVHVGY